MQAPYLRPPEEDVEQTPAEDDLGDHPIALRTFAVFPPFETLCMIGPCDRYDCSDPTNSQGVTVGDVVAYVQPT